MSEYRAGKSFKSDKKTRSNIITSNVVFKCNALCWDMERLINNLLKELNKAYPKSISIKVLKLHGHDITVINDAIKEELVNTESIPIKDENGNISNTHLEAALRLNLKGQKYLSESESKSKAIPNAVKKSKSYNEGSLADLAAQGIKKISELSHSQKISDKLSSLNALLFVFTLTVCITQFLTSSTNTEPFMFLVLIAISFTFSLVTVNGYVYVLDILSDIASNKKISVLRISITILFISLSIAIIGLALKSTLIMYVSLGGLALQLITIPFTGFFSISNDEDIVVRPGQIWTTIGKIADICGIMSFIIAIIVIIAPIHF